ncbi:MAG: M23 family metallopeptidase [DPANN group archaeon]|nr:M23 family metallopeptidase [DPANN group archaeon]
MVKKNQYGLPIDLQFVARATTTDSPAHAKTHKHGKHNQAIDFVCPVGTPVKASLEGIVVDVKDNSTIGGQDERFAKHGNFVEIRHPNGEYSIYEHIQRGARVRVGDRVTAGQVIALSGATGWLAHLGPHLHFEVHKYRTPYSSDNYKAIRINWDDSAVAVLGQRLGTK